MLILLLIIAGAAALLVSAVSAEKPFVTIVAKGSQSYYHGEEVIFSGMNTDSDSTYLFITGPNLPDGGGKLSSPLQNPVSGDPGSFTIAKTNPDKTWEYTLYTSALNLDAGSYTIYAVTTPKTKDHFNDLTTYGTTSIIHKKPFITGEISPSSVSKGLPFTVKGIAEGIPPEVQIWILGNNFVFKTTTPVNSNASFTFNGDTQLSEKLPKGQCFLILQHPMADNQSDFVVSGDYVRNLKLNNGTNLFRLTGPGSLQGRDAADALSAAISDQEAHDQTLTNDTYTIIPFQVTDAGSSSTAGSGVTISAVGDKSYYLGEKVVFRGKNADSDSTYLFMIGPDLPAAGVELTSPNNAVVSGNPDTFTVVKTNPDKSWEYTYYTINLPFLAGTYSVYAASQPKSADTPGPGAANVGIALKKPFITANISSSKVVKGQPFTVTGIAEGIPPGVQIWIIGDAYAYTTKTPVNSNALFTFNADAALSEKLITGQNYLIVQHPMADNQFDFVVSGDYVRNLKLNNGTNVFRLTGPGSLQGSDAADALSAAISDQEAHDQTLTNDTYTLIPFQVTGTGSPTSRATAATTAPAQRTSRDAPLENALQTLKEAFQSFF
ncbi:hypothetical protein [Methanoregula sp.]|uniref:hypothetical protein n=1 Tax=Methanoregula sp. TaxID=2052170 RepID=UPI003562530F